MIWTTHGSIAQSSKLEELLMPLWSRFSKVLVTHS